MDQTTNYNMFKKHESNRPIDQGLVGKLEKSISMKNLLEFRPIMVNKSMEVIDGQHRLEAAKKLGLPIFYQVQKGADSEDILLLNTNQKHWNKEEYLHFWVNEGKEEYRKLFEFMKKHKFQIKIAMAFLNQSYGGSKNKKTVFSVGNYKFPSPLKVQEAEEKILQIQEVIGYLKEKMIGDTSFLDSYSGVIRALVSIMNDASFEFTVLMKKLPYRLSIIRPCSRQADYIEMFRAIYNWKNANPIGFHAEKEAVNS